DRVVGDGRAVAGDLDAVAVSGRAADRTDDIVVSHVDGGQRTGGHALDDAAAVPVLDREAVDGDGSQGAVAAGDADGVAGPAGVDDRTVLGGGPQGQVGGVDHHALVVGAVADIDGEARPGRIDA